MLPVRILIAVLLVCVETQLTAQDSDPQAIVQVTPPQTTPFTLFITPVSMILPGTAHYAIGETSTGTNLIKIAGWSWSGILASASVIALTGAADLIAYGFIPITVISAATLLAAGAADIMGSAFPTSRSEPQPKATQSNQSRTALYAAYANDEILGVSYYLHAAQTTAINDFLYRGRLWLGDQGRYDSYSLGLSRVIGNNQIASLSKDSEQFYIDLDVEYTRDLIARYDMIRLQSRARIEYPMAPLGRTLKNMHFSAWLGFYRGWARYVDFGEPTYEPYNALTGGTELLNRMHESCHFAVGYEHSRSGRIGGTGQGYFGNFHTSLDLRISHEFWGQVSAVSGSPNLYLIGAEYRKL